MKKRKERNIDPSVYEDDSSDQDFNCAVIGGALKSLRRSHGKRQQEIAAMRLGEQPVDQGHVGIAHMQEAGGRRRETGHGHGGLLVGTREGSSDMVSPSGSVSETVGGGLSIANSGAESGG